jgi:hypothetical protein
MSQERMTVEQFRASQTTEHDEQATVFDLIDKVYIKRFPELEMLFAIPNGGLRNIGVAIKLKKEGVQSGIPDLMLPLARRGYHGLFIETKTINGHPSNEQVWWLSKLSEQGYFTTVAKGADAVIDCLMWYLT